MLPSPLDAPKAVPTSGRRSRARSSSPCSSPSRSPAAGAAADAPLLYLTQEAASAAHDAMGGPTLRQAPLTPDGRWPAARTVGKVRGRDLAGASPARIAAMLRAGWRQQGVGGLVAVDEMTPPSGPPLAPPALAAALDQLGGDAQRVIFYAAPSMVERVGRADPRAALARAARPADRRHEPRAGHLPAHLSRRHVAVPRPRDGDAPDPLGGPLAGRPRRAADDARAGRRRSASAEVWARVRSTVAGRDAARATAPPPTGSPPPPPRGPGWPQYRAFRARRRSR